MDDIDKLEEKDKSEEKNQIEDADQTDGNQTDGKDHVDEIETEWAKALHLDYDPEEARRRAEEVRTPPPPPVPAPQPPHPAPAPRPAPYCVQEPMPQTYLIWSVLATVFCCLVPGVVAIVYSTMVSSRYYAKDYEGARRASDIAQYWIIASIVLGVITAAVYVPLSLFA